MIPQACKDGNMDNRNLYHFCLAILIFLDITVPLSLLTILYLTANFKEKSILNKTLGGTNVTSANSMSSAAPAATSEETRIEVSATACCSTNASAASLAFGLVMFLIFVTIAGVLGQASDKFCNGYVRNTSLFF